MNRKTRIFILLGVSTVALALYLTFRFPAGPYHAGKPLDDWLKDLHAPQITVWIDAPRSMAFALVAQISAQTDIRAM